jgi:hypothetical protein
MYIEWRERKEMESRGRNGVTTKGIGWDEMKWKEEWNAMGQIE